MKLSNCPKLLQTKSILCLFCQCYVYSAKGGIHCPLVFELIFIVLYIVPHVIRYQFPDTISFVVIARKKGLTFEFFVLLRGRGCQNDSGDILVATKLE